MLTETALLFYSSIAIHLLTSKTGNKEKRRLIERRLMYVRLYHLKMVHT